MFGTVEQVESHLCVKAEREDPRNVFKVDMTGVTKLYICYSDLPLLGSAPLR